MKLLEVTLNGISWFKVKRLSFYLCLNGCASKIGEIFTPEENRKWLIIEKVLGL
jgi:hypothetical protein